MIPAIRSVKAQVILRNAGDQIAGPSRIACVVSADGYWDASDTPCESASAPSLKPGKTKTISLKYTFPAGTNGRSKFFIAVLEAVGAVVERDELNNEMTVWNGP